MKARAQRFAVVIATAGLVVASACAEPDDDSTGGSIDIVADLDEPSDVVVDPGAADLDIQPGDGEPADGGDATTKLVGPGPDEMYTPSVALPVAMYYLGRYLEGKPIESDGDAAFASTFDDWEGDGEWLASIYQAYRDRSEEESVLLYDQDAVAMTADIDRVIGSDELVALFGAEHVWSAFDPPVAPSGLTAANAYQLPNPDIIGSQKYQIEVTWVDESLDEEGFFLRRHEPGGVAELVADLGPGVTSHLDELTEPESDEDEFCYQVASYRTVPSPVGEPPIVAESVLNETACSTYGFSVPPLPPDADGDGVPDHLDECRYEHSGWAWLETNGCPDFDRDGIADKYDNCPNDPADIAHDPGTSGYVPDTGCPHRYALRWMGMEVLNNTGAYAYSQFSFSGPDGTPHGLEQNEVDTAFETDDGQGGEEPYLVFSWVNGMYEYGSLAEGTARWCCGDLVDVKEGRSSEPDMDGRGEEAQSLFPDIVDEGFLVFPAGGDPAVAKIHPDMGLFVAVSLLERDYTTTVTVEEQKSKFDTAVKIGTAAGAAAKACFTGGIAGCIESLAKGIKTAIEEIFGLQQQPQTVEIDDPDDFQGTEVWSIDRVSAQMRTNDDGAYGFTIQVPMTHMVSCLGWTPCNAGQGVPITMLTELDMCLYREGVPLSQLETLCAPYEPVVPWPQS